MICQNQPHHCLDHRDSAGQDARIAVHKRDGLEALGGLVPPLIRRGVVLIDPSYEMKGDYAALPEKLKPAVLENPL